MIATLITSCSSHKHYLEQSVFSACDCADFLILGFDYHDWFPPDRIVKSCDIFFTGCAKGKQPGETFSIKRGLGIARDVAPYVLKITGDAILEKPQYLNSLIPLLGDNDYICPKWNGIGSTLVFFGKSDKLFEAAAPIQEVNYPQIERRFWARINELKLKYHFYPMENDQGTTGNNGMWGEVLGYRHIHREKKEEV
jgi:hypothetical protein